MAAWIFLLIFLHGILAFNATKQLFPLNTTSLPPGKIAINEVTSKNGTVTVQNRISETQKFAGRIMKLKSNASVGGTSILSETKKANYSVVLASQSLENKNASKIEMRSVLPPSTPNIKHVSKQEVTQVEAGNQSTTSKLALELGNNNLAEVKVRVIQKPLSVPSRLAEVNYTRSSRPPNQDKQGYQSSTIGQQKGVNTTKVTEPIDLKRQLKEHLLKSKNISTYLGKLPDKASLQPMGNSSSLDIKAVSSSSPMSPRSPSPEPYTFPPTSVSQNASNSVALPIQVEKIKSQEAISFPQAGDSQRIVPTTVSQSPNLSPSNIASQPESPSAKKKFPSSPELTIRGAVPKSKRLPGENPEAIAAAQTNEVAQTKLTSNESPSNSLSTSTATTEVPKEANLVASESAVSTQPPEKKGVEISTENSTPSTTVGQLSEEKRKISSGETYQSKTEATTESNQPSMAEVNPKEQVPNISPKSEDSIAEVDVSKAKTSEEGEPETPRISRFRRRKSVSDGDESEEPRRHSRRFSRRKSEESGDENEDTGKGFRKKRWSTREGEDSEAETTVSRTRRRYRKHEDDTDAVSDSGTEGSRRSGRIYRRAERKTREEEPKQEGMEENGAKLAQPEKPETEKLVVDSKDVDKGANEKSLIEKTSAEEIPTISKVPVEPDSRSSWTIKLGVLLAPCVFIPFVIVIHWHRKRKALENAIKEEQLKQLNNMAIVL